MAKQPRNYPRGFAIRKYEGEYGVYQGTSFIRAFDRWDDADKFIKDALEVRKGQGNV